jgi:DNA-binding PadR family transcriptional regulator
MEATDLPSGTVYQMLRRFERDGLVRSRWETPEAAFEGRRPRRRNYQLTKEGRKALARAAERYHRHLAIFGASQKTRPAG